MQIPGNLEPGARKSTTSLCTAASIPVALNVGRNDPWQETQARFAELQALQTVHRFLDTKTFPVLSVRRSTAESKECQDEVLLVMVCVYLCLPVSSLWFVLRTRQVRHLSSYIDSERQTKANSSFLTFQQQSLRGPKGCTVSSPNVCRR